MKYFSSRGRKQFATKYGIPFLLVFAALYALFRLYGQYEQDLSYFLLLVKCKLAIDGKIAKLSNSYTHHPLQKPLQLNVSTSVSRIPKIIHQMWKDKTSISSDMKGWMKECQDLNEDYTFKFYDDGDLNRFVESNYPEYWVVFKALSGVWMADMARLLIIYHYGGIYMDMDFYCHRPFSCIEEIPHIKKHMQKDEDRDTLIVSLEPAMHSIILYNNSRVVIQDFLMTTPKNPFFKWLLDDRNAHATELGKKPFSYSIQKDIDRYKQESLSKHHNAGRLLPSVACTFYVLLFILMHFVVLLIFEYQLFIFVFKLCLFCRTYNRAAVRHSAPVNGLLQQRYLHEVQRVGCFRKGK